MAFIPDLDMNPELFRIILSCKTMFNEYQTRLERTKIYSVKIYSEEFRSRSFVNKVSNAFFGIWYLVFSSSTFFRTLT
jgi:hypothetical protein